MEPQKFSYYFQHLINTAILVFFFQAGSAQVQHINFRHYSLANGLSSYKVAKVLQDRYGFMWIATQDGLNRFDGKDIIIYNKSAPGKHLLVGNDITDMVEDTTRNMLWVITSYGGLNGIDLVTGAVNEAIPDSANRFSNPWLRTLIQYGDELWIGTYNNISIYHIRDKKIKKLSVIPDAGLQKPKAEYDINLFYKDEFDRIWTFSNYGLTVYSSADHSILFSRPVADLGLPPEYFFERMNSCLQLSAGELLLATYKGIKRIRYNRQGVINIADEKIAAAHDKEIRYMTTDWKGNLWFATDAGLYIKSSGNNAVNVVEDVNQTDRKKWTNSVNVIFFDRQNNLWLGTLQGFALATRTRSPFLNFFQSADLKTKLDRVTYTYPYNDSVEFICAYDGIYKVENNSKKIERLKPGTFWFITRHRDGQLMAGADNRFYIFNLSGQFTGIEKVYPELGTISNETVNSAIYWNDSLVFLGSEMGNGVFIWDFKNRTLTKLSNKAFTPLKDGIVNNIYKDRLNRIWILSDKSFAIYHPASGKLGNYELINPETGRPLTFFFDMSEASGYYWLASYGSGLIQLDDSLRIKNIVSTDNGMSNAGLYNVFTVNDSTLLTTSNKGLSKINTHTLKVANYFENDGLHSNAFEETSGAEYKGKVYAGGPDGFTIIDPLLITANNHPPELHISNIVFESKTGRKEITDLFLKSVRFPRNLLQATIYFSGINYFNPELTTYRYRIIGQHSEWVNLGTQNFVNLTGMKPDTYTLEVQAFNEEGMSSDIKEVTLVFLPKWFQTWWFRIAIGMLITGIVFSFYRIRISQLKKEKEIRSHLASDLHDDLGSTLNSVKVYANMAIVENENRKYLEKVKESTQEAITGVRDIIWVLDDKKDNIDHLVTRITTFAGPLCEAANIRFNITMGDGLLSYKLGKEEKRNLYMIIKEAINNSIKYAESKTISLIIESSGGKLKFSVTDDGKGFDRSALKDGNGLKNIITRAGEIGYSPDIKSVPGEGTSVIISRK
jgi:ligand-binding sensor domain-containing protein/two-component sensor histidine kinase